MAVSIESFLALEKSLASRLHNAWRRDAAGPTRQIIEAAQRGDFVTAVELCDALSLAESAARNQRFAEFVGTQAILFGASRLSGDPRRSVFMGEPRPEEVKQAAKILIDTLQRNATESVCRTAIELLNDEQVAQEEGAYKTETRRKTATAGFVKRFATAVDRNGNAFIDIGSSLHTSRLSAWGFTVEATSRGITRYQVSEQLDSRTCPVCRTMDGRSFSVPQARAKLEQWLSVDDPDDMKSVAPWPKQDTRSVTQLSQMTESQIAERGWDTPPYHPLCRGVLVKDKSVPVTVPVEPPVLPTPDKVPVPIQPNDTAPLEDFSEIAELATEYVATNKSFVDNGKHSAFIHDIVARRNSGKASASKLVGDETFHNTAGRMIFRGVSSESMVASNVGSEFVGTGIFGNGQYYAYGPRGSWALTDYGKPETGGWAFASKLKADARVISQRDLAAEHRRFMRNVESELGSTGLKGTQLQKAVDAIDEAFDDPNAYAAWKGYDAVDVEQESFMIVLNKNATITHRASLPGQRLSKSITDVEGAGVALAERIETLKVQKKNTLQEFTKVSDPQEIQELTARYTQLEQEVMALTQQATQQDTATTRLLNAWIAEYGV